MMWYRHMTSMQLLTRRIMKQAKKVHKLEELGQLPAQYDVIAIDEGQFFLDVSAA